MKDFEGVRSQVLELTKHCFQTVLDERQLMMSQNMAIDVISHSVWNMAIRLSESVYGSAWKVQVVEGPVIKVPATWVDMLQLRVKYCDTVLLFFLWPLVWLFFRKRKVQYREVRYPDIEFKARELFPQLATVDGQPNIVVHERPRFMQDFDLFEKHISAGDAPKYHEEPAYILCRHCHRETELKEVLRPQQMMEKQMERSKRMGPVW